MMELRPYQLTAVERIRQAIKAGKRKILVVAPTASGKTIIGAHILTSVSENYRNGIFVAHRREIINQTSDKLDQFDTPHGILMAGKPRSALSRIMVCSVQTFHSRITNGEQDPPFADVVIIDEAHRSISSSYQKLIDHYPEAIILGLTATPVRADGCGMGRFYDEMVEVSTVAELMELGFLVRPHVFAPSLPDLKDVKVRAGDYVESDLEKAMNQPALVGDIVRDWKLYAEGRPTVVFTSGVKHSRHIVQQFLGAGVRAEHIDGQTPKDERDEVLARLDRGEIDLVSNCQVLTEGWDQPKVSCCILARPTKSYGLYLQMAGRILRPAEGKQDAVIIDHAGAVYEHGFVEDAGDWSLDPGKSIKERRENRLRKKQNPITCRQCFLVYERRHTCPRCGWEPTPAEKQLNLAEGRLYPVSKKPKKEKAKRYTKQDKRKWYAMLRWHAEKNHYNPGWIAHKYRDKFGVWPRNHHDIMPLEPDNEVRGFITHTNIRYVRRRQQ